MRTFVRATALALALLPWQGLLPAAWLQFSQILDAA
jgi:hypothetical protein